MKDRLQLWVCFSWSLDRQSIDTLITIILRDSWTPWCLGHLKSGIQKKNTDKVYPIDIPVSFFKQNPCNVLTGHLAVAEVLNKVQLVVSNHDMYCFALISISESVEDFYKTDFKRTIKVDWTIKVDCLHKLLKTCYKLYKCWHSDYSARLPKRRFWVQTPAISPF